MADYSQEVLHSLTRSFIVQATRIQELEAEVAAKQAKIDALMMEFCPEDVTEEQYEEWAKHQKPVQPRN